MSDGQTGGCHDSITGNFKKITKDHVVKNFKTITIDHSGAFHELHNAKRMGFALMVRAYRHYKGGNLNFFGSMPPAHKQWLESWGSGARVQIMIKGHNKNLKNIIPGK